jgi:hypothetical protein
MRIAAVLHFCGLVGSGDREEEGEKQRAIPFVGWSTGGVREENGIGSKPPVRR